MKGKSIFLWIVIVALAISLSFVACKKQQTKVVEQTQVSKAPEESKTAAMGAAKQPETAPVVKKPEAAAATAQPAKPISPENAAAIIEMAKGGRIVIEFYPKDAPISVNNFIKLASKGFYDGLKFHRVIAGFMAQTGDPTGIGSGGPGYTIKDEFNSRKHLKGTVAMARPDAPDSAGSQFYICFEPQPSLDNNYTVFGQVIEGLPVVDGIKQGDVMKKVTIVDKASLKK